MSKLVKKYFKDFFLWNLDDVEITSPSDEDLLSYDGTTVIKNTSISEIKKVFKHEFPDGTVIPAGKTTLMIDPCFEGEVIIEGCLEVI